MGERFDRFKKLLTNIRNEIEVDAAKITEAASETNVVASFTGTDPISLAVAVTQVAVQEIADTHEGRKERKNAISQDAPKPSSKAQVPQEVVSQLRHGLKSEPNHSQPTNDGPQRGSSPSGNSRGGRG